MTAWILVAVIVASTTAADVLQSREMKRHGEIKDFRPNRLTWAFAAIARRGYLILAVFFMAVSFFAFLKLLSVADFSFAVPATAASFVVETILARFVLKEHVSRRRWIGTLLVASGVALLAL
ncbi:MAG: EamA family transporter [Bryobacteraceae bacterium]|jgi:Predicted membrane protein|nr:EamA family transporter [Bryobacteraceae bacterium]